MKFKRMFTSLKGRTGEDSGARKDRNMVSTIYFSVKVLFGIYLKIFFLKKYAYVTSFLVCMHMKKKKK